MKEISGIIYLIDRPLVKLNDTSGIWARRSWVESDMKLWNMTFTNDELLCTVYAGDIITKDDNIFSENKDWRYTGKFGKEIRFPFVIPFKYLNVTEDAVISFTHKRDLKVNLTASQKHAYGVRTPPTIQELYNKLSNDRTLLGWDGSTPPPMGDVPPMMDIV